MQSASSSCEFSVCEGSTVSEDPRVPRLGSTWATDLSARGVLPQSRRFKKDLCKYFERGHCDKGAQCTFAHGWEELRDGGSKAVPFQKTGLSLNGPDVTTQNLEVQAASSNGSLVHHGPSWESGPPPADKEPGMQ